MILHSTSFFGLCCFIPFFFFLSFYLVLLLFVLCLFLFDFVVFSQPYMLSWHVRQVLKSGAEPGFFLGGGALVSCSTSTPINHIVFSPQNTSCIRKPQVILVS